jgi:hypothetical protein
LINANAVQASNGIQPTIAVKLTAKIFGMQKIELMILIANVKKISLSTIKL